MTIPDGLVESDFECGTFVVPTNWDDPDGERLSFEVAVLHARNALPKPDPLIILGGGPGGWILEGLLQRVNVSDTINREREIVFFDQRGNGLSNPSLHCPEYEEVVRERFGLVLGNAEEAEAFYPGIQDCYHRLYGDGIELSNFNSYQLASDIQALMSELGYQSYNLYGASYGGLQAQIMMREHPEGIRSVILDSPAMPEVNDVVDRGASFERSLNLLFDACQASSTCNSTNPDLKRTLIDLVESLNEVPHYRPVDRGDGTILDVYVTGSRFLNGFFSALYRADYLPLLPTLITATAAGNTALLDAFVPQLAFPGNSDRGLYLSANCIERAPFIVDGAVEKARGKLDPNLGAVLVEYYSIAVIGACDIWDVTPFPANAAEPVISDIPTLIISGQFDPITPPSNGERAQENLTNGQYFMFKGLGHGVLGSDKAEGDELSCSVTITLDFLENPSTALDGSCASKLPGPFD